MPVIYGNPAFKCVGSSACNHSRPDVWQCLVAQTHMDSMSKHKPSTSITHIAWKLKVCSVVKFSMHSCPGNWVAIGYVVVYYA